MPEKRNLPTQIRPARPDDAPGILMYDRWISAGRLIHQIDSHCVYVIEADSQFAGWMRYGLFWDNIPFLNLLHLLAAYRRRGIGRIALLHWEDAMRDLGHACVLTSAVATSDATLFFEALDYTAAGCFTLPGEPEERLYYKAL